MQTGLQWMWYEAFVLPVLELIMPIMERISVISSSTLPKVAITSTAIKVLGLVVKMTRIFRLPGKIRNTLVRTQQF
jgi:hypothetical protein